MRKIFNQPGRKAVNLAGSYAGLLGLRWIFYRNDGALRQFCSWAGQRGVTEYFGSEFANLRGILELATQRREAGGFWKRIHQVAGDFGIGHLARRVTKDFGSEFAELLRILDLATQRGELRRILGLHSLIYGGFSNWSPNQESLRRILGLRPKSSVTPRIHFQNPS